MIAYEQLETQLKNQDFLFRDASIIDLSFHYFWALIGFYERKEHGNYFEKQNSITINESQVDYKNIISDEVINNQIVYKQNAINNKKILIFQSDRTQAIIDALEQEKYITQHKNNLINPIKENKKITKNELNIIEDFANSTINIFNTYNIILTDYDKKFLTKLIIKVILDYLSIYNKLLANKEKISLIIAHADNHPSPIYWIIAAKIVKIPTLMLQHGLDCEPYFLEDAYSDYIAVWGNSRKERYELNSRVLPKEIRIIGNPNYDKLSLGSSEYRLNNDNLVIGYIGRPHGIEKSYFSFRDSKLGNKIVHDLNIVAEKYPHLKIVCKLHPYDDKSQYKDMELNDNIMFSEDNIEEFLQKVDIVFSEDSTSAVESLIHGKPLFLLNYENTTPIVDLLKYNAGIQISNTKELESNVEKLIENKIDFNKFNNGQKNLIDDYLYQLDGKSTNRVLDFIDDILYTRKEKINELSVCTVVTKNYLKYADTLYQSLVAENGKLDFYVLVVDSEGVDREEYQFKIIGLEELEIPMIEHMCIYYNAFELVCILKPFLINYLILKRDLNKIAYFDVDIFISSDLYELSCLMDTKQAIFNPHFNQSPSLDRKAPTDIHITMYGIYNGGFWAFTKSDRSLELLNWFMKRFYLYGFDKGKEGMSGDQPLITLSASLFDDIFYSLKEPTYNIAYWNIHERDIIFKNNKFYIDRKEAVFFHLSGFKEAKPEVFSNKGMHYQRIATADYPSTKNIIKIYQKYISMANTLYSDEAYGYNKINGETITPKLRENYFNLMEDKIYNFLNNVSKKDVLLVTDLDFWNVNQGSKSRILSLILYLKEYCNLKVIYIPKPRKITKEDKITISSLSLDNIIVNLEDIPIYHKVTYLKELPETYKIISKFYSHALANRFNTYIKTHNIDYCIFEYFNWSYLLEYLDKKTIKILDTHDIIHLRAKKFKENNAKHWFSITKDEEFNLFKKYDYLLSIQNNEFELLNKNGFEKQNMLVPHGSKLVKHTISKTVKNIIFVAGRNDVNLKSIKWFLENVWVYYQQIFPKVVLHIYGRVNQDLENYVLFNVKLHGFIENYDDIYINSDVVINPVLFGGGLKIKSVEAICNGLPLVSSLEGVSGMLEIEKLRPCLMTDKSEDFLEFLIALTMSYELRLKLSENAYSYAEEHFSEDVAYKELINIIENKRVD